MNFLINFLTPSVCLLFSVCMCVCARARSHTVGESVFSFDWLMDGGVWIHFLNPFLFNCMPLVLVTIKACLSATLSTASLLGSQSTALMAHRFSPLKTSWRSTRLKRNKGGNKKCCDCSYGPLSVVSGHYQANLSKVNDFRFFPFRFPYLWCRVFH